MDVGTIPGPRRPVPDVCRILCSNVRGLAGNLSDLTVASSQYDILLCSDTFVSDMRHVSEVLVPGFGRPVLCGSKIPRGVGWLHRFTTHFATQISVWLLRNAGCQGLWCETEPSCLQSLLQP